VITHNLKPLEVISEEQIAQIEATSFRILEEVGVKFNSHRALDLFANAGVKVDRDDQRVYLPRGFVLEKIKTAPEQFTVQARNPKHNVVIGGNHIVFASVYGCPFVFDLETGERRWARLADFQNLVKLAQSFDIIHFTGGTIAEPSDLPVENRHLDMVYSLFKYSDKGVMGSVTSAANARDSIELAAIVFGGRDKIEQTPALLSLVNANSPLLYDERMAESLIEYVSAGQAMIVTPFILAGAMAPVTMAGAIAQQNAEALAGITLAQLVRPGAPVVYGSFSTNLDMRTGSPFYGSPESSLAILIGAQFARRYHLPFRSGGTLTTAKVPDAQAGYESAMGLWPTILAGTNFVLHAAGWLDGGLVSSFEQFVIDVDLLGNMATFLKGIEISDDTLAFDTIKDVGPGGYFVGEEHTLAHYKTAYYDPIIGDTQSWEVWQQRGSKTAADRAHDKVLEVLEEYQPPPMDPAVDEALQDFIARRKSEILVE
jgi:trimethylamine--corrinoid protein Co-methyltransferase